jgi:O-antigen ligase
MAKARRSAESRPTSPPAGAGFDHWLQRVATVGLWGGLAMPLVVIPGVYNQYTFPKMVFFQVLLALTFPAFGVLAWRRPEFRPRLTPPLLGLLAFLGALGLATLLADDPWRGFWSVTARMTGLYSLLHLLAWVMMANGLLPTWAAWTTLLRAQLAVGGVMAAVALVQVVVPTFAMFDFTPDGRVSGLTGNPIFLATYLVFTIFIAGYLRTTLPSENGRRSATVVMIACALAMIASGSRGPLLGLVAGGTVALLVVAYQRGSRRLVGGTLVALLLASAAYAGVATLQQPPEFLQAHPTLARLFVMGDAGRAGYWGVTWDAIQQRPWLGWGHENLEVAYVRSYRPVNPCTPFYEDRPHNLVLEVLAAGGILALLAWGFFWGTLFRAAARAPMSTEHSALRPALLGLLTAHLVQSGLAFDTPSSWLMLALVCALLAFRERRAAPPAATEERPARVPHVLALSALGALGVVLAFSFSLRPLYGSSILVRANTAFGKGDLPEMFTQYRQASRHVHPYGDDWLVPVAVQVAKIASNGKLGSFPGWRTLTAHAQQVAGVILADAAANARLGPVYGRMLAAVAEASHDAGLSAAAGVQLKRNMDLNPRRQNTLMDYADWLVTVGRTEEARPLVQRAVELDPNNAGITWRAGFFTWKDLHDQKAAARLMVHSTTCPCGSERTPMQVAQLAHAYAELGDLDALRGLVPTVEAFPREETRAGLAVATLLEVHGLTQERTRVLSALMRRNPTLGRYAPVVEGRTSMAAVDGSPATATP